MGALHQGHLSLIDACTAQSDFVVTTIFVNPLQFAPTEDLSRYPRTFEQDLQGCQERGVDLVFAPSPSTMYPDDFSSSVRVEGLTARWEGEHRPDHFVGVTTVVAKLFNLVGPCSAFFGRKDYQQWRVIERMVADLDMPIKVVGCPIVRESDGLALSSRNRYLSSVERQRALSLVEALRASYDAFLAGERNPSALAHCAQHRLDVDTVDYVAATDPQTLEPLTSESDQILIAIAAHIGATRLIDNTLLGYDRRP